MTLASRRLFAVLVALVVATAGCGTEPDATPSAATSAARPSGEQAYLDALAAIDPELVAKPDRVLSRGRGVCLDITQGKSAAAVVDNARQRFDGGDVNVDAAMAKKIVKAAKDHLCA